MKKVGIFLHGENNQNPKRNFSFFKGLDLIVEVSKDDSSYKKVVDSEIEHRAGEFLYSISEEAQYVKFTLVSFNLIHLKD